jgi:hypothetical protein
MKTKGSGIIRTGSGGLAKVVEALLPEIRVMIEEARHRAVTAANLSMVTLYWNVGRVINTEIQSKPGRAGYGEALLARLGQRLNEEYGQGFSERNLRDMRRFYFEQACAERWSERELQRQIGGALFERVALSSDTRALVKLEQRKAPTELADYREAFKDPYLLDFLGLTATMKNADNAVHAVTFGGRKIDFELRRTKRKTLAITVKPDTSVVVTAPNGASLEAVAAKVRKRAVWIRRQQDYFATFLPQVPPRQYVSGETHRYLGRQYRLKVLRGAGRDGPAERPVYLG